MTGGDGVRMMLWDVQTGELLEKYSYPGIDRIEWFSNGEKVLIEAGSSYIYNLITKQHEAQFIGKCSLSNENKTVRSIVSQQTSQTNSIIRKLRQFNANTGELLEEYENIDTGGGVIETAPNARRVMIGSNVASMRPSRIIDSVTGIALREYNSIETENEEITRIVFSCDGRQVANVLRNKVLIYDISELNASIHGALLH